MLNLSLKTKMFIMVSLLVAASLSLAMLSAYWYFSKQFKEVISGQQFTMVSAMAEEIDSKLANAQAQLVGIADTIPPDTLKDPQKAQAFLRSRSDSRVTFDNGLFLLSPLGRMITIIPYEAHLIGKDYTYRDYFKRTSRTLKPQISQPLLSSRQHRHPTITFTAPILDDKGRLLGVLGGSVDLLKDNFLGKLAAVKIGNRGYFYLFNSDRTLVVHPNRRRILKKDVPPGANRLFDQAVGGFEGTGETVTSFGMRSLSSFKRLKSTNWILAVNFAQDEAYAAFHRTRHYLTLALIGSLCCSILVIAYGMRHLMAPLLRFIRHVEDMTGAWKDPQPVKIEASDEIGTLAQAFNQLLFELARQKKACLAEQEFCTNLVQSAAVPIFVIDTAHRVIIWNRSCEELTGVKASEIVGTDQQWKPFYQEKRPVLADIAIDGNVSELQYFYELSTPSPLYPDSLKAEGWFQALNGADRYITFAAATVRNAEGEIAASIETLQDITDKKQMMEELSSAVAAADAANKAKSQFLANMSHEIRTPMNGVLGMTELLIDSELTQEQRRFAEMAHSSGQMLLSIINDILDFSKIEAGKMELDSATFLIRTLVEDALGLFAEMAQRKGVELACLVHRDVPPLLVGDPVRLRQILMNLINNGVKFTERGEVTVHVKILEQMDDAVILHFAIRDSGVGIPKDAQSLVFRQFSQLDGSVTRKQGGTGLGLAIAKQLVVLMGGEIGVTNEEGAGSLFWFTLPLQTRSFGAGAVVSPVPSLPGLRVLLVDDNATVLKMLAQMVNSWGIHADTALSGKEALTLARASNRPLYDIAILDLAMREMDGIELALALKDDPATAPRHLLMLTSFGGSADLERIREAGVERCLSKPVRHAQLFDSIASLTGMASEKSTKQPVPYDPPLGAHISAHILLVEDNPVNQEVCAAMLEKLGSSVTVAGNGLEALERWSCGDCDLVIMDCQMPELDGYQAALRIRAKEREVPADPMPAHIPIIALTAHALEGDQLKCLAAGMDDYLPKPFSLTQLQAKLERWLPGKVNGAAGAPTAAEATPTDIQIDDRA